MLPTSCEDDSKHRQAGLSLASHSPVAGTQKHRVVGRKGGQACQTHAWGNWPGVTSSTWFAQDFPSFSTECPTSQETINPCFKTESSTSWEYLPSVPSKRGPLVTLNQVRFLDHQMKCLRIGKLKAKIKAPIQISKCARYAHRHSETPARIDGFQPETEAEGKRAPVVGKGWPGPGWTRTGAREETPVQSPSCLTCSCVASFQHTARARWRLQTTRGDPQDPDATSWVAPQLTPRLDA